MTIQRRLHRVQSTSVSGAPGSSASAGAVLRKATGIRSHGEPLEEAVIGIQLFGR
jgi:hypothetical protein